MKRVIAEMLYFFKDNNLLVKRFLREVTRECTNTFYVEWTNEYFKKSEENKPKLLYGNTIDLWQMKEVPNNYNEDEVLKVMTKELQDTMLEYLQDRHNNISRCI